MPERRLATAPSIGSDAAPERPAGGGPPRASNRVRGYRRIGAHENFFLCSAICSAGKALGSDIDDLLFYAAHTGDLFTPLYAAEAGNPDNLPCDSGLTNYFFDPLAVKKAFAAMGRGCVYLSNAKIREDFRAAMDAVKASVDRGVPVVAWGMGNVITRSGTRHDPMGEGCLIGGYEGDTLLVNLYPGPERLPEGSVDADGYSAIEGGLDTALGLFFAGERLAGHDPRAVCQEAIRSIPLFLSLAPARGYEGRAYAFGQRAFEAWAQTLLDDRLVEGRNEAQLREAWWNLHGSPYCCVCTAAAWDFVGKAAETYSDMDIARRLLPLYGKLREGKDELWALAGGFWVPADVFATRGFRAGAAEILRRMGGVCAEILRAFA